MHKYLKITFHVCYDYDDFANAGFRDVAYYDENDELVIVSEPSPADFYELWLGMIDGYDGEITGYSTED